MGAVAWSSCGPCAELLLARSFLTRFVAMSRETRPNPAVEVHGYALRVIRQARGRTVADLARALEVDRSYIRHLENGSKLRVSPEFYAALLRELQIEDYRALLATAPLRDEVSA
jgi:hypothetical protein